MASSSPSPDPVEWIDNTADLQELCAHLREQPFVAVDTEFHRERTYYAQLALLQVASTERVACIDPLADVDLAPLYEVLADESCLKVVHAGRQDLEVFFDRTQKVAAPVFDTQVAAALLGYGDQIGYAALVSRMCKVSLDKAHGRTDWMRRPLDEAVIRYAADDVRYLVKVYERMRDELDEHGRAAWLADEQADLLSERTYRPDLRELWRRLKGAKKLKGVERAAASEMTAWREREARRADRPKKRVLSDDAIVDLARQRPRDPQKMERIRSLDPGARKRYGRDLLKCIATAAALDESEWPEAPPRGPDADVDDAVLDALMGVCRVKAREHSLSASMLATRGELEKLAAGDEDVRPLHGWRREVVGQDLLGFLRGEHALVVDGGELRVRGASKDATE
jgi:ribonuclease D